MQILKYSTNKNWKILLTRGVMVTCHDIDIRVCIMNYDEDFNILEN